MAGTVLVRIDATPNPNSLKFTVNRELSPGGGRTVASAEQAFGLPLAARLLEVPGVRSLFFLGDFVTVSREPGADWDAIAAAVRQRIEEFFGHT